MRFDGDAARQAAACGAAVLLLAATTDASERWPQFRGADAAGVSQESRLPERWSATENVAWSTEVPGRGWSSPIVWGKKVFLTSAVSPGPFKEPTAGIYGNDYIAELRAQGLSDEEVMRRVRARDSEAPEEVSADIRWMLFCLDADTGRIAWQAVVHTGKPFGGRHRKNTYASETPATDGERVYVYLGNIGVFAYGLDGTLLWKHPLTAHRTYLDFGTASSPIVHEGRVYVLDDNQEESALIALDARTGKEAWRTRRDFGDVMVRTTFSTPFLWRTAAGTEIVTLGAKAAISYDLEGKERWRLSGTSQVGAPTPVASGDLLFLGSGSPSENVRPMIAVRPGAKGDISLAQGQEKNEFVAWYQVRGGSYITSPLVYGSRIYVLYDQGFFGAFDAATGKPLYKARFPEGTPTFSSSPWAHDGRVFCLSEDGDTFVIAAGDEFKVLGKNTLGDMSLATPAVAHESLFLRTATRLYRIRAS